ncbi:acyl-CoA carboxylase epsilon subunit [Streptomyces sp. NPDC093228]|uniref:acyl-CoA carboxylase epsilon subunit n=1 Tax=Streptomyces sp. NPDC093228 TaxID=3155070 RepID=UPI00343CF3AD
MTIKVVRGNPTPEELAAALAVVRARAAAAPTPPPGATAPNDLWADRRRAICRAGLPQPSAMAWRSTYWPR